MKSTLPLLAALLLLASSPQLAQTNVEVNQVEVPVLSGTVDARIVRVGDELVSVDDRESRSSFAIARGKIQSTASDAFIVHLPNGVLGRSDATEEDSGHRPQPELPDLRPTVREQTATLGYSQRIIRLDALPEPPPPPPSPLQRPRVRTFGWKWLAVSAGAAGAVAAAVLAGRGAAAVSVPIAGTVTTLTPIPVLGPGLVVDVGISEPVGDTSDGRGRRDDRRDRDDRDDRDDD
jgi:hypothetical protein